jgi:hypothetical protein
LASFGFFSCLGYLLFLRAHNVARPSLRHYAAFPVFIAFPTWYFLAEFLANAPSTGIGLALSGLVLVAFRRSIQLRRATGPMFRTPLVILFLAQVILAACIVSLYQSLITLLAVGGIGVIVSSTLHQRTSVQRVILELVIFAVTTILGLGLYFVIWKGFLWGFHLKPAYIDKFIDTGTLLARPKWVLKVSISQMMGVYAGNRNVYGSTAWALGLIAPLGLLALGFTARLRGQLPMRLVVLLLSGAILLLPFAQNLVSGGQMPLRTLVSVPIAVWLFLFTGLEAGGIIGSATLIVAAVATAQILYTSALFAAADAMAKQEDERLAAAIYTRIIEVRQETSAGRQQSKVDFFGSQPTLRTPYPRIETIGAPVFEWDGGSPYRIVSFYNVLGYRKILPVTPQERQSLLPEFAKMDVWPAKDSVRVVGDVTLVKLGDQPDDIHAALMSPARP